MDIFCWMPYLRALACAFLLILVKPARSSVLWHPHIVMEIGGDWSLWRFAMLFGAFVGLMFMAVFVCICIPFIIMTWTTALVIQSLFGEALGSYRGFIADSHRMGMDMCRGTAIKVYMEGKLVAFVIGIFCFVSLKKLG